MAPKAPAKLRAVGYCRTSGPGQKASQTTSIGGQDERVRDFVAFKEWKLVKVYIDESVSGGSIAPRDAFVQMMRDAEAGMFDVLVPFDVKRFARDGFDILNESRRLKKQLGIRTVDTQGTHDSDGPPLINFLHAGIAEMEVGLIKDRTYGGKVRRARDKSKKPPIKAKPWGRTYDTDKKRWVAIPECKALLNRIAKRYLNGENPRKLAEEFKDDFGSYSKVYRYLKDRRTEWGINFVDETVEIPDADRNAVYPMEPLLSESTIDAIYRRMAKNKKGAKGAKRLYLLSGYIYCEKCGYALTGQDQKRAHTKYRHSAEGPATACPKPWPYPICEKIEEAVVRKLLETFSNPPAIRRAIEAAIPNLDEIKGYIAERDVIDGKIAKLKVARKKQQQSLNDEAVSYEDVKPILVDLNEREQVLVDRRSRLTSMIETAPSQQQMNGHATRLMKRVADLVAKALPPAKARKGKPTKPKAGEISFPNENWMSPEVYDQMRAALTPAIKSFETFNRLLHDPEFETDPKEFKKLSDEFDKTWVQFQTTLLAHEGAFYDRLSFTDKRALIEHAFDITLPDGRQPGVYVRAVDSSNHRDKDFEFTLRGNAAFDREMGDTLGINEFQHR
ncbi:MAG TPA: recombinase family protein [Pirellulales bacterium]|jgi:site-specific DNA recombinase